jgi:hypothetical protein
LSPGGIDLISNRDTFAEAPARSSPAIWQKDMATFLARWGDCVGRGWSREHKEFNDELFPNRSMDQGIDREGIERLHASLVRPPGASAGPGAAPSPGS